MKGISSLEKGKPREDWQFGGRKFNSVIARQELMKRKKITAPGLVSKPKDAPGSRDPASAARPIVSTVRCFSARHNWPRTISHPEPILRLVIDNTR